MESFGVDFGTTNSAAVGWSNRSVERYFGCRGIKRPLPSVVAIHKLTGEIHSIGLEARDHRENLGAQYEVISSVKALLSNPDKSWTIGPKVWKPEDVAAAIIKELRKNIAGSLGPGEQLMNSAVFSIPVGCSMAQRQALRRAARLADIQVISFISEPTAALCRHFNEVRRWPKVAVFDWGGGTLDISIVEINGDVVSEVATFGKHLGGDNLDYTLAEYLHGQIMLTRGSETPFSAVKADYRDLLIQRAELAKISLGQDHTFTVQLTDYCGSPAKVPLTLNTMLGLFKPFMTEALQALKHTVENQAHCSPEEIGCLLMVGGTSKLRGLSEFFRSEYWLGLITHPHDADWSIAQGAAINASKPGTYIAGQDFGLAVSDGSYYPLIHDGQPISINDGQEYHFGLVEDSREARIVFVQPKGRRGYDNGNPFETLGYLSLPAYGFSDEPIALKTWVDQDLVVNVSGHSTRREAQTRDWHYEKLRFRYKLPNGV
ncbi:MAG: Hsp70 family protein [Verrucomicrobiota bacterium]|jgi:molecular chaperone DnaK